MTELEITNLFKQHKFRATPQRIAVYKYLIENRTHPDADEIYKSVLKAHPSFSKTTVYNALQALQKESLIIKINIDSTCVRYDACTSLHGHFVCEKCKKIFDFNVSEIICDLQKNFEISDKNVYYTGTCPDCK